MSNNIFMNKVDGILTNADISCDDNAPIELLQWVGVNEVRRNVCCNNV